jgi:hypothetical protein
MDNITLLLIGFGILIIGFTIYKVCNRKKNEERYVHAFNPCEDNKGCKDEIKQNCTLLQQNPQLFAQYGYKSLIDCTSDPRQVPLKCQHTNRKLFCEKFAPLVGQSVAQCKTDPGLVDTNVSMEEYKCAYNSDTYDQYRQCVGQLPPITHSFQCVL